jgi:hypothetical protein
MSDISCSTQLIALFGTPQAADGSGGIDPRFLNARTSQKFGVDLSAAAAKKDAARSGDADLPVKAPLHERRARLDSVKHLASTPFCCLKMLDCVLGRCYGM